MIASEFFTADLPAVSKLLFNDPDLMQYLFSFVARKPLNYLLAGYFLKAYESCLAFDSDQFMKLIFSNNYHISLLGQIRSTSVSEILLSILQQNGFIDERISLAEGICKVVLSPDALISANAAGILLKITKDDEIFPCFSSEAIASCLLNGLLGDSPCVAKNSGLVVKNLLLISPQSLVPFIRPYILALSGVVCSVSNAEILSQFGVKIKPFGEHKVILLDIFAILCSFNMPELSTCLTNILALLPLYDWSTYFHNSYAGLIESIINSKSSELVQILIESNFTNMLIELAEKSYTSTPKGLIQKGSIGHLYKLINLLVNSNLVAIEENFKFLENWKEFEGKLGKYNEIEAKYIGGKVNINFFDNMSSDSTDKADEIDLIPE